MIHRCQLKTCKKELTFSIGKINRAKKSGLKIYCDRVCAGLGRRDNKTIEQKKRAKRKYDKSYRAKNLVTIKKKKAEYCKTPEGRATQKRHRIKSKEYHLQYCRQPWYKKWKQEYDQKHVASKKYGEFAEVHLLNKALMKEVDNRLAKFENNLINKTQKRKRLCKTIRRASNRR